MRSSAIIPGTNSLGLNPLPPTTPPLLFSQDPQYYFMQGVRQASQQQYPGAISAFSQALLLDPEFLEAYMGRCQARHVLGDARGVLNDCEQILRLHPDAAQAYYFRGRASARLGYMEPAFEAYTESIQLDQNYAQSYYHRGMIQVQTHPQQAAQDLKTASVLFRQQGNISSAQRAEAQLVALNRRPLLLLLGLPAASWATLMAALTTLPMMLFNPTGTLLPAFEHLSTAKAVGVGVIFAAISICCLLIAIPLYGSQLLSLSWVNISYLGGTLLCSLVGTSRLARLFTGSQGNWASDLFLSGSVLLWLGFGALLSVLFAQLGPFGVIALAIFTGCYTIFDLAHWIHQTQSIVRPGCCLGSSHFYNHQ